MMNAELSVVGSCRIIVPTLEQGLSGASPCLTWLSSYYLYSDSSMSAANGLGAQTQGLGLDEGFRLGFHGWGSTLPRISSSMDEGTSPRASMRWNTL